MIKKITRPLRDHFGIGYFTYHRIDEAGRYTVLVDRPDWAEHYVSEQIYLLDPYLRHPAVYESGMSVVEAHGSEEYKEVVLKVAKEVLKMDMGVMLIQKKDTSVEFFGFSGNKKACSLQNLYLNHPQLLHSFALYFKRELGCILHEMEQEAGSLIALKGRDFFCADPICPDIASATLLDYYRDLGMRGEVEKAQKLSPRERQCLKLLIDGRSAKETGAILGLSARTVEFYFQNIKVKLSCWSKHEVLVCARQFEGLGLL